MSADHFRGNPAHVALLNDVWTRAELTAGRMPDTSPPEAAAFAAGVRAVRGLDLATSVEPGHPEQHVGDTYAARITALLVELARRYPAVVTYPGRLLEVGWPVLVQAQAQGLLPDIEDRAHLRRVVGAAAGAVADALHGPVATWWRPYEGHWLWASTTRSKTTGLPLPVCSERVAG